MLESLCKFPDVVHRHAERQKPSDRIAGQATLCAERTHEQRIAFQQDRCNGRYVKTVVCEEVIARLILGGLSPVAQERCG